MIKNNVTPQQHYLANKDLNSAHANPIVNEVFFVQAYHRSAKSKLVNNNSTCRFFTTCIANFSAKLSDFSSLAEAVKNA